ncbi:MAG: hypothetical protein BGO67_02255 [Alphaproteobacteria bacterium 41-28]|nr:MAG: hypothetical protein BGO67_02255 [Alphaproteobacteria bacterium 41-28]
MSEEENEPKRTTIQYKAPSEFQTENVGLVFMGGSSIMDRTDESQETQYLITDPLRPCIGIVGIGKIIFLGHKASYNLCDPSQLYSKEIQKIILYSAKMNEKDYEVLYKEKHDGRSQKEELEFLKSLFIKRLSPIIPDIERRIEIHLQEGPFNGTLVVSSRGEVFNTSFEETVEKVKGHKNFRIETIENQIELLAHRNQKIQMKKRPSFEHRWGVQNIDREFYENKQYGKFGMFFKEPLSLKDILDYIEIFG